MPDASSVPDSLTAEASNRTRFALADSAFKRAKRIYGARTDEELAKAMGMTRMDLYRLKHGVTDIRLSRAIAIAAAIGLPVGKTFAPAKQKEKKVA